MYKYITRFTPYDKQMLLKQAETEGIVDELMKPLVHEINMIPELATMNCCIGGSLPYTEKEIQERGGEGWHCPRTYVDFYVINHHYEIAHSLLAYIQNKFGGHEEAEAWGSLIYEEDGYITEDDYFQPNGKTSLRFSIEGYSPEVIPRLTELVKEFKDFILYDE